MHAVAQASLKICVSFRSAVSGAMATEMRAPLSSSRPNRSLRDIRPPRRCAASAVTGPVEERSIAHEFEIDLYSAHCER